MLANVIVAIMIVFSPPAQDIFPPIPSPTAYPSATPAPTVQAVGDLYRSLATSVANVNALPDDITRPNGANVAPDPNAASIFGYGKWIFSPTITDELLGRQLSPLAARVFLVATVGVILTTIFLLFNFAVMVFKFVFWVVLTIRNMLPFI